MIEFIGSYVKMGSSQKGVISTLPTLATHHSWLRGTSMTEPIIIQCRFCQQSFRIKPSAIGKKFYCSRPCMAEDYKIRMSGDSNPNYRDAGVLVCAWCKESFRSYSKVRKYCSWRCAGFANNPSEKMKRLSLLPRKKRIKSTLPKRKLTCVTCGVNFRWTAPKKFCLGCSTRGKAIFTNCVICGISFRNRNKKKTCSAKCWQQLRSQNQIGEKSHRWQGGKTTAAMIFRNSVDYSIWRKSVYERDDFTCQLCKSRGGKLAAHHILEFAERPDLALNIKNGVTLCWPCHTKIRWKEKNYIEQFFKITGGVGREINQQRLFA